MLHVSQNQLTTEFTPLTRDGKSKNPPLTMSPSLNHICQAERDVLRVLSNIGLGEFKIEILIITQGIYRILILGYITL